MLTRPQRNTRARGLRQSNNDPEAILWSCLRSRQLANVKFVRQFPIGPYFADFCARSRFLVVEVDGSQHATAITDAARDAFLNRMGFAVLRFWSVDVLQDAGAVCETIVAVLDGRITESVTAPDLRYLPSPHANRLRTLKL